MKISQKRICGDCKALDTTFHSICLLGYSISMDWDSKKCINVNIRPIEPCPKPLTNLELVKLNKKGLMKVKLMREK